VSETADAHHSWGARCGPPPTDLGDDDGDDFDFFNDPNHDDLYTELKTERGEALAFRRQRARDRPGSEPC
jgi:hypothetical protein